MLPPNESLQIEDKIEDIPDPASSMTLEQYFQKMNVNKEKI
jgi:hypothetical protein